MSKPKSNKTVWALVVLLVLAVIYIGNMDVRPRKSVSKTMRSSSTSSKQATLQSSMRYLSDIQEVAWYEVDDNTVYIGFDPIPSDMNAIIRGAALGGNQAIDFGVHVWAINARTYSKGWRPGDGSYLKEVTARDGKIK